VPSGLSDEQVLFLGDILPTGWQAAVQCDIEPTDTVAIWGAGPVGQLTIRSAILLGANQVIAIDDVPERLSMADLYCARNLSRQETWPALVRDYSDRRGMSRPPNAMRGAARNVQIPADMRAPKELQPLTAG
jgi:threonine dehydrogenase-like Zn-dependent dehydrogenase